ncbi:CsbD family protein, partial [Streptomyces sp. NPDC097619]|uniref:CsbD family protein n=1 Tax=Streptomyces sp. NPDC097619 TaxID=3157228 RepID=UPI0033325F1B
MGKIKGKADQVKGKVKEETGAAAGDTGLEMKGKAEKTKGRLEENASDAAARIRRMSEACLMAASTASAPVLAKIAWK